MALTSRLQTFEAEMLAEEENFVGLARINRELIAQAEASDAQRRIVLDMDSTAIAVYGQQENSAYNDPFESTCYHPVHSGAPELGILGIYSHWPQSQKRGSWVWRDLEVQRGIPA